MNTNEVTHPDELRPTLKTEQPTAPLLPAKRNLPFAWDVADDPTADPTEPSRPFTALVSFHYLHAAVRRRRAVCLLSTLVGALLGVAFLIVAPQAHTATSTLVLAHDPQVDPARAMATDVGLLTTRTVAERVISTLGSSLDPDELRASITALPSTSDVLEIKLTASSDAEAVRRLDALTKAYLEFRGVQVSAQSDALMSGYRERIGALQNRVNVLTTRIGVQSKASSDPQGRLSETIAQRAQIQNQISSIQESAEEVTLRRTALVAASRVIDPAAVTPASIPKRVVLALASGMIGGAALGIGGVLLHAILSDRLRLRVEVAAALQVPVPLSVGRLRPPTRLLGWLPSGKSLATRQAADLQRMAHEIERALPEAPRRQRLAVACVENADEVGMGVAAAAIAMHRRGRTVHLVDLSESGGLESAVARLAPGDEENRPKVHRPAVIPSIATGPAQLDAARFGEHGISHDNPDVCLVLADLDPRVGADHLTAWTERVIVVVTRGKSSVDRIRTTGDLIRAAKLEFRSAVLIRALSDDMSSGAYPLAHPLDPREALPSGATTVSPQS